MASKEGDQSIIQVTYAEKDRAMKDWEALHGLFLVTHGMRHAPFIREHIDNGGHIAGFLDHQCHADYLMALRAMNYVTDNRIERVGYAASSKLFPGGEMFEKAGRRMFAFGEAVGIKYFKVIQHYNQSGTWGDAMTSLRAFRDIRDFFEESKDPAYVGIFIEGGRGDGNGVLERAQDGAEYVFTSKHRNVEELVSNDRVLGVPISLENTRYILDEDDNVNLFGIIRQFDIHIGQPFFAKDISRDMRLYGHSFADSIGARIASLKPEISRGYYGDRRFSELVNYSRWRNKDVYENL